MSVLAHKPRPDAGDGAAGAAGPRPGTGYAARRFTLADVLAGLTVALVLVPQSLAYAQLAGMPPERGLYAAAIPLLIAAPLACSPYLQTGPVAVTSVLTFGALSSLAVPGSDEYVALGLALALVVGVVRIAIGLLHAGVIAYLMSQPMLIGFIPAAATADPLPPSCPTRWARCRPTATCSCRPAGASCDPGAWELASAVLTAAGVSSRSSAGVGCIRCFPACWSPRSAAIAFSKLSRLRRADRGQHSRRGCRRSRCDLPWGEVPAAARVRARSSRSSGYAEAGSIARAFAAEDRERWDSDREFVSQGAANVAAAFSGGFPVGGSFSRSSLNRLAGGRSRWSGAVTGVIVLLALLFAGRARAAAQGDPRRDGHRRRDPAHPPAADPARCGGPRGPAFLIAAARRSSRRSSLSPHVEQGVLIGVALSIAVHLWRELRIDTELWTDDDTLHVTPRGVLWFGAAQALAGPDPRRARGPPRRAAPRPRTSTRSGALDITGAIALRAVIDEARRAGISAELAGVHERDRRLVERVIETETPIDA